MSANIFANNELKVYVEDGRFYDPNTDNYEQECGVEIAYIKLYIEHPENMLGISRIESVTLYDENDDLLYDDQELVDNKEFSSDYEVKEFIAEYYNVPIDIIDEQY